MPAMLWRRGESYSAKDDLERIMRKLMAMDEKLDEILARTEGDDVDEEEE